MTLAILDVDYRPDGAHAACVLADGWLASTPAREVVTVVKDVAAYQPGEFFRRELPCLLAVLKEAGAVDAVIIDGYVWLDGHQRKGLGAHLYEALGQRVPVVGVAKHAFAGSLHAAAVTRGGSESPLYVTSAGIDQLVVAEQVRQMHGPHRLPTLIKRVDSLARGR